MANDSIITNNGKNVLLRRAYTATADLSATEFLSPTEFQIGIDNDTPNVADTALDNGIPIGNGTVNDDGSNTLTGSSGGDNTTNNTTTFKDGANTTDVTAQNLIANGTATTKIWTIADLASAGTDITAAQPYGLWFFIKDATALAKIVSFETKFGSDSSNYFSKTVLVAAMTTGWNWITSGTTNVNALTETGTVSGDIDTFIIEIVTNLAADTFVAGDTIYDLLRQWATSDLTSTFVTGFPTFNTTNIEVSIRCFLNLAQGTGFDINGFALFNEDTSPLMTEEDTFTAESKGPKDEFAFVVKNRIL